METVDRVRAICYNSLRMSMYKRNKRILAAICCFILASTAGLFCYGDDEKPLFVFDYQGSHIETYSNYSIVDGKVSETHRYFVQSGNLVVIDQELHPTARDIFIHFSDGKSYIAVLTRSGQMVSLGTEDLCTKLENFTNRNIAAITNNINTSSTTLFFTYKDGSAVAYDCLTGKRLSGTPATEKKSFTEYVSGFLTDFVERSTQGLPDTSGAIAESVVNTLEDSGATLEELMEAGLAESMETAYQESSENWDGEVYDFSEEFAGLWDKGEKYPVGEDFYDFSQDETYQTLMNEAPEVLTKEQLVELRDLFARVASGDTSASEAAGRLVFFRPEDSAESEAEGAGPECQGEGSGSNGAAGESGKEETLEHFRKSIEDMKAALESIEKKQEEKKYIQASLSDKYLAVYNAKEKRYDIYNQEELILKPDELVSEAGKLADAGKAEALNKLLAGDKGNDMQSGIRLFMIIAAAIVAATATLLAIAIRNTRNRKASA